MEQAVLPLLSGRSPICTIACTTFDKGHPRNDRYRDLEIVDASQMRAKGRIAGFDAVQSWCPRLSLSGIPLTPTKGVILLGGTRTEIPLLKDIQAMRNRRWDFHVMIKMNADDMIEGGLNHGAVRVAKNWKHLGSSVECEACTSRAKAARLILRTGTRGLLQGFRRLFKKDCTSRYCSWRDEVPSVWKSVEKVKRLISLASPIRNRIPNNSGKEEKADAFL